MKRKAEETQEEYVLIADEASKEDEAGVKERISGFCPVA
jgi:peptidyl-prolyl cis-trans isomerase D